MINWPTAASSDTVLAPTAVPPPPRFAPPRRFAARDRAYPRDITNHKAGANGGTIYPAG